MFFPFAVAKGGCLQHTLHPIPNLKLHLAPEVNPFGFLRARSILNKKRCETKDHLNRAMDPRESCNMSKRWLSSTA